LGNINSTPLGGKFYRRHIIYKSKKAPTSDTPIAANSLTLNIVSIS